MGVLDGVKVLEVGSWIAGPAAATIMSDFGAEVIKVEPPGTGDPYRGLGGLPGMPVSEHNYSWLLDSRNKKSLALDVTRPEGRDVLLRLAAKTDVFLTNFPLALLARLGLTWEDLSAVNPRLIYALLTAYGEVGEGAAKPGFDVNAWWARSGLMDLVRAAGAQPTSSMPGMGDHPTAVALFGAIALGLYQRERTGRGAKVSTSLMGNGAWANSVLIQALLCGATFVERPPREQALNALVNLYQCRDGRWLVLTMLTEDKDWERFARAIGRADLISDSRFATMAARHANSPALVKILDGVFGERDWGQWEATLEASDIPFEAVARLGDLRDDRQMAATGTVAPLEGAGIPGLRTVMSPIQVEGQTKVPPTRAPDLGEHTDEVLRAAGYDAMAIRWLRDLGVVA
ncbi:MAG: CoA transferase [Candidatus Rokubacteria bacterium]|nr:CoA transferase [Candidatus Rokubacteria bacterium]